MKDIIEVFLKFFFAELTWRKLLAAFILLALGFGCYERYTASFRLGRLQQATELLARLQEVQARSTNSTPDLERARTALMVQAVQAIEEKPVSLDFIPSTLTFSIDGMWKFIAGGVLWFAVGLFQLSKIKTKQGRNTLLSLLIVAAASGFVAIQVPAIWWPWFHILIYPWLFIAAVASAFVPIAIIAPALGAAQRRAQAINCTNNLKQVGLGARLWAMEHGDVLPPDLASMKSELGNDKITCCPADTTATYKILSPGASLTDPAVVYARCTIHNHVVLADGSAIGLGNRLLVQKDGKWTIQ